MPHYTLRAIKAESRAAHRTLRAGLVSLRDKAGRAWRATWTLALAPADPVRPDLHAQWSDWLLG